MLRNAVDEISRCTENRHDSPLCVSQETYEQSSVRQGLATWYDKILRRMCVCVSVRHE